MPKGWVGFYLRVLVVAEVVILCLVFSLRVGLLYPCVFVFGLFVLAGVFECCEAW